MSKLLHSEFRRYMHSYALRIVAAISVLISAICSLEARRAYFADVYFSVFLIANVVLISWIVGREHEEGLRNKIVAGHTKGNIFISKVITAVCFSAILYFLFSVIFLIINGYIIGHASNIVALKIFLAGLTASICTASITVTISCLLSQRALIAIVNILLIIASISSTYAIKALLDRPQYWEQYRYEYVEVVDKDGNTHMEQYIIEDSKEYFENSDYIKPPLRNVLKLIARLSPFYSTKESGDITQNWFGYERMGIVDSSDSPQFIWDTVADFSVPAIKEASLNVTLIFSAIESVIIGAIGYLLFRRKEMK